MTQNDGLVKGQHSLEFSLGPLGSLGLIVFLLYYSLASFSAMNLYSAMSTIMVVVTPPYHSNPISHEVLLCICLTLDTVFYNSTYGI